MNLAYVKNTWQAGDEVTAEKLNHIESGIEDAGSGSGEGIEYFILHTTVDETDGRIILQESYNDILTAVLANKVVGFVNYSIEYVYDETTSDYTDEIAAVRRGWREFYDMYCDSTALTPYCVQFDGGELMFVSEGPDAPMTESWS